VADLPSDRPLERQDMTPLAIVPSDSRTKQEVSKQLTDVAQRCGTPVAVLSDGARELHEGVKSLQNIGFQGICLDDVKHKVSNLLRKTLGKNERFSAFETKVGQTTSAVQQTELEHLLAPRRKQKCRFMNFGRLIDWATMIQQQLDDPGASPRLREKFGWLHDFDSDLARWRECRGLIGRVLSQANTAGVTRGSTDVLRQALGELPCGNEFVRCMRREMVAIYQCNEDKLKLLGDPTLRLPCSTELLESAFGSFKALQRHHNRGTFTSLLPVLATLFETCTAPKIRERFARLSNQDLKSWLKASGLANSTHCRKMQAHRKSLAST